MKENTPNSYIWITQIIDDSLVEIIKLQSYAKHHSDDADFERLKRMPFIHKKADLKNTDIWIDLCIDDNIGDNTLSMDAYYGQWLLKDIFKQPKKYWNKIKLPQNIQ